jgi:glucose uptake protein GlcU
VPTKVYRTGDGIFFQWVLCTAILFAGCICFFIECAVYGQCPSFQPLAVAGGVIWAIGNAFVVPIVKCIGLALGLLIWGTANLVAGWGSGRFGWFGLDKDTINNPALNDVGVILAVISLGVSFFVRTTVVKPGELEDGRTLSDAEALLHRPLVDDGRGSDVESPSLNAYASEKGDPTLPTDDLAMHHVAASVVHASAEPEEASWVDRLSPLQKRLFGVGASILSGLLYGVNFDPPQYVIDHREDFPGAPTSSVELVFSHFVGIWMTSTVLLIGYAILKGNRPVVYPRVIVPGFISGVMWAIAQISWFLANDQLEFAVSFPLVTMGPGLVASLWGIFVFAEIRGARNYLLLALVFAIAAAGATCIVMSKL